MGVAWSSDTTTPVGTGLRIGAVAANTARAVAQASTTGRAITLADSIESPNRTADWFLPSREELDEMNFHETAIGGFAGADYWSSSESGVGRVWTSDFVTGNLFGDLTKDTPRVRPVRAS